MKKLLKPVVLAAALAIACSFGGCTKEEKITVNANETLITIAEDNVSVSYGENITETDSITTSNDIVYYEDKDTYESGNPYGAGSDKEKHTAEEAAAHTVINISKAGTYRVSGTLSKGQIKIDLGEDAADNPDAVVNLILDNANISCNVAPAILFQNVYECDGDWTVDGATSDVDTSSAGANIILADGSINNITGSHVAKIYKDKDGEKKLWKQDGAVYSYMSMNVSGENDGSGLINITADNEGLDTELHLTINSGNINIRSNDDGINTNEDGVSVTTINGGNVHIIAGLGSEGDGIDSNGFLVINGGYVVAAANPRSDSGLDSDMGSFINGGTVIALGSTMDWAESDSDQVTINLQFAENKESGDAIIVANKEEKVVFAYDPSEDEVIGKNIRQYSGAVISCPAFTVGDTYNVYIGGVVNGEEFEGFYDTETITDFTDATMQAYTGTDVMHFPGGFGGGKHEPPEGFELPKGFEMPEFKGGEIPEPPEAFEKGEMKDGEKPEPPEGLNPFRNGESEEKEANTEFYMQDKVNFFSGLKNFESEQ